MQKMKYPHVRKSSKKPWLILLAVVLAAASVTGGVFAWRDFSQSYTNIFHSTTEGGATLHDEFDGENKDVFVENTGLETIYVRVRLDEYMQIGESSLDPAANSHIKSTWCTHTYDAAEPENCGHIGQDAQFHDYYKWTMSGAQRDYNVGTSYMVYTQLGADGKVDETGTEKTAAEQLPILMSEYVAALDAKNAYIAYKKACEEATENNQPEPTPAVDEPTQAEKDLLAAAEQGCWILDDTEPAADGGGWAYWSRGLRPITYKANGDVEQYGEATNLLLDKVEKIKEPAADWTYRIDVKMQAVTLGDTKLWHDDSANAPSGYLLTDAASKLVAHWNT